jgi:hypothetical protein
MNNQTSTKMRFLDPIIDSQTPIPMADYMSSYTMNGNVRISWFGSSRKVEEFLTGQTTPPEAVESEKNIGLPARPTLVLNMSPETAVLLLEHLTNQLNQGVQLPYESHDPSYISTSRRLPENLRELADKLEKISEGIHDESPDRYN